MVTYTRRVHRERGSSKIPSRESLLTTKSGFSFTVNTPKWDIDRKKSLNISRLDSLELTQRELSDLRYAFAILATNTPFSSLTKYLSGVTTSKIQSLTSDGVMSRKAGIPSSQLDSLKAVARELKKIDRDHYTGFNDAVFSLTGNARYNGSSIYDAETGALSEYEFGDLTEKLNIYSNNVDTWHEEVSCPRSIRHHTRFSIRERLLVARFIVIFSRRPGQIAAIKWGDLSTTQSELGVELELSIPMIK